MNGPSKILPFKRPSRPFALHLLQLGGETFPRFRREWNRPNSPTAPLPHDPTTLPPGR